MGLDAAEDVNVTLKDRWDRYFFTATPCREAAVLHGAMTAMRRRPAAYLRPYALADAIRGNRPQMLQQCLVATYCGLLHANWCITCPRCDHLICCVELPPSDRLRCLLCHHEFGRNRAAGLELVFVPDADGGCGTPITPQSKASPTYVRIAAGSCAILPVPLLPERYAVWRKRRLWALVDVIMDAVPAADRGDVRAPPEPAAGEVRRVQQVAAEADGMLRVHGAAQQDSVVGFGPVPWGMQAVRVHDAMQEEKYRMLRAKHFCATRQGAVGA